MSDNEQKDIADEEISGEEFLDEEFEDEAWEEESDSGEAEESAAPVAKKKSSKFNLILVTVAVLGGGGFFMMKSGGNAPAPVETQQPALPEMAAAQQAAPAPEQAQEVAQAEAEKSEDGKEQKPSGGFLNDPSAFEKIEQMHEEMQFEDYSQERDSEAWKLGNEEEAPVSPAPGAAANNAQAPAAEPLTPMPETPVQQAATQQAAPIPPVAQSDLPPPSFPKAQDILTPAAKAAAQTQTSAPAPAQQQAQSSKPENIQAQADTDSINKKLADLDGRMNELETALESLEVPAISGKEIADLKAALARLEGKVDGLSKGGVSVASASAPAKKKVAAVKEQVPTPAKVKAESVSWVLKSAQPGKAIVSKAGQAEVYSVSIGDKLEGIGKITSVEQKDGMWVVQGSAGKITQ